MNGFSNHSLTFVFGVESGIFEPQTVLAVECLRKFGGRFADAPVLALTPRLGPPLTRHTLRRFDELGVTHIRRNMRHPDAWFPYMNKALACMLAEEDYATTDQIAFLDSDTLIIQSPELLELEPDVDFAICSTDKNVGTSGPDDKNEPYWLALCKFYGIDINKLPWIMADLEQVQVRFRLHSGVFSFRRGSGVGRGYLEGCERMLQSRVAYSRQLPFPGDDVGLAFAIVLLNLRWRILPASYNYQITPHSTRYRREQLADVKVLHYHKSATRSEDCSWMLSEIKAELPELYEWLRERVPLYAKVGGLHRRLIRYVLAKARSHQRQRVEQECVAYVSQ